MPTQTANGTTLNYSDAGSGPNLLLIHGFPLSSAMWEGQIETLSDENRVIAPDLRGFGKSPSNQPFTMESLAGDLHALLKNVGALPAVLAGFSMGGYVALSFAKKYPKDLRGLVLIDTRAEGDSAEGKHNRQKMIDLVRAAGSSAVAGQMLPKMLADQTARGDGPVARRGRQIMESCSPLAIEHALAAMRDREDHTCDLASIPVPVLILVGEQDAVTPPALSRTMNDLIPHSRLAIIPNAGHLTPMENPDEVNHQIRAFVHSL